MASIAIALPYFLKTYSRASRFGILRPGGGIFFFRLAFFVLAIIAAILAVLFILRMAATVWMWATWFILILATTAHADWLVYRDAGHLRLITADLHDSIGTSAFERTAYEGTGSSVHIEDRRGVFSLVYNFDLEHTPAWINISLTQERNGVIRWEERNTVCQRQRVVRWFCNLDSALADGQVRCVLGSLLRRLDQPPRILDMTEIAQTMYGPPPKIDIPHDTVQGQIRYERAIAGLPKFKASTRLLAAIDETIGQ